VVTGPKPEPLLQDMVFRTWFSGLGISTLGPGHGFQDLGNLIEFFTNFFWFHLHWRMLNAPYKLSKCQCDAQNSKAHGFAIAHQIQTIQEVGQVLHILWT
jgi:hypothetical protein